MRGSTSVYLRAGEYIALTHHERWDGKGYPKGLSGDAIPRVGRIVAIADAFEAMTATQRRRQPMSVDDAAKVIISEAGKQFDPALIEAFKKALPEMKTVRDSIRDELEGIHNLDFALAAPAKPSAPPAKRGPLR